MKIKKQKLTNKEKQALKMAKLEDLSQGIDINNYNASTRRRNIYIFCTTLFSHMTIKHRFMFVVAGRYPYPLKKTYEELMRKKKKEEFPGRKKPKKK